MTERATMTERPAIKSPGYERRPMNGAKALAGFSRRSS